MYQAGGRYCGTLGGDTAESIGGGRRTRNRWLFLALLPTFAHLCPPVTTLPCLGGTGSSIAVPGLIVVGTSVHLAAVLLGRHQDVKGRPLEEKTSATNPLLIGQEVNPSLCWLEWAFRFLVRFGFGTCHRRGLV